MDIYRAKAERLARAGLHEFLRRGMPSESTVSFPIPTKGEAGLEAHVFIAVSRPARDMHNAVLYLPTTLARVDWESEQVLEVRPPGRRDYEPAGLLLPATFAVEPTEESDQQLWEARQRLFLLLDEVGPRYGRDEDSPELRSDCLDALHALVTEDLWPRYEEVNADFLRWLSHGFGGEARGAPAART